MTQTDRISRQTYESLYYNRIPYVQEVEQAKTY